VVFFLGVLMAPLLARTTQAPVYVLIPIIAALTMVGSFAVRGYMFDVYFMFALGIVAYVLKKIEIPVAAVALGLILGPIVERGLDVSLQMSQSAGVFTVFFARPISLTLIVLTVVSVAWIVWSRSKGTFEVQVGAGTDEESQEGTRPRSGVESDE